MKGSALFGILIIASAWGPAAHAQFVDDNVSSDSFANTGGGTEALAYLSASGESTYGCSSYPVVCYGNTAFGYFAVLAEETGNYNTGIGFNALGYITTASNNTAVGANANAYGFGSNNTAVGAFALSAIYTYMGTSATGAGNTAVGYNALTANTTGYSNTASGSEALMFNTTGTGLTASGAQALYSNTTGINNTASGYEALYYTTTGNANTASGFQALLYNTTGNNNTASGYEALFDNTGGNYNNASGYFALHDNTSGSQNSASGVQALFGNKTGNYNTASGTDALYSNTSGSSNVAEGYKAGYNLTTGSNNIDIGNLGAAAESGTIRIGTTSTQTKTFIAGIYGTSVTGSAVVVSSTGQLGVTVSSERFKTAIAPMGSDTARLDQLRPVSFKLKSDATGTRQYGLIAEEVAKVYPELVIRDASGRIDGVRYDELAPMLLNEMQQQQRRNAAQAEKIAALGEENAGQGAEIRALREQMAALTVLNQATQVALRKVLAKEEYVAER